MVAKQILVSASLMVVLNGTARAQPAATAPSAPATGEAHKPTGQFGVGAGYNTDDGFIAGAEISNSDLFHTGNGLSLDAEFSQRHEHFDMKFVHPLGDGTTLETSIYNHRDLLGAPIGGAGGFMRDAAGGTLTLRTHVAAHVIAFLTYRLEQVGTESGDNALARGGVPGPSYGDVGTIASLATGLEYSTLDRKFAPTRGTSAGVMFEAADPMLGSDVQLAKLNVWINTHQSFGPFIVHVGGSYGSVTSKDGTVPLSERLFLDGSSQLRGYAPGALMADGASRAAFGRAEIELPVWKRAGLSVRAFEDAGAMFDQYGFGQAAASSGFGILLRSPIGPVSVDVAFPLDGGKPVWLFNVGGAF